MLQCGHTFCTDCILDMSHSNMINCSYCAAVTSVETMGVYALLVKFKFIRHIQEQEFIKEIKDLCFNYEDKEAVKICYNCDPLGCKLCEDCCTKKHERDCPPVHAHKPICIEDDGKKNLRINHRGLSLMTHYFEECKKFVCQQYLGNQPDDVKADYEHVVQESKSWSKQLNAHHNISTIQNQLMETGPNTIKQILEQFTNFQEMFQKRQSTLHQTVDAYVSKLYFGPKAVSDLGA